MLCLNRDTNRHCEEWKRVKKPQAFACANSAQLISVHHGHTENITEPRGATCVCDKQLLLTTAMFVFNKIDFPVASTVLSSEDQCVCVCVCLFTCLMGSGTRYWQQECVRRTAVSMLILWPMDTYTGFELLSELRSAWTQRNIGNNFSLSLSFFLYSIVYHHTLCWVWLFSSLWNLWRLQQQNNTSVKAFVSLCVCLCLSFNAPFPALCRRRLWVGSCLLLSAEQLSVETKKQKSKSKQKYNTPKHKSANWELLTHCGGFSPVL